MPTLWPFKPNGPVLERLEWMTDVLESSSGVEQRIALRRYPRRYFEFDILLDAAAARTAENLLAGNGNGEWYLPVWMDAEPLAATLSAGATSVPAGASVRDYTAGNMLLLMGNTGAGNEGVVVDTPGSSAVTLAAPTAATWPAGSLVVPLRTARLPASLSVSRFTGASLYGRLRWQCVDATDWSTATETTYRSYPVMTHRTNWDQDPTREYATKQAVIDSGVGVPRWIDIAATPIAVQNHRWLCDGRAEIDAMRRWFFSRRGRLACFWLPSWGRDLEVQATIGASDTTIDVEHCSYTDHIAQAVGRRDIRIELTDGTVYYRRITASAEIDADTERLTISSALGASVSPASIYAISFMHLARLDTDAVEIAWHRWDVAEAVFTVRGIRNDL